MNANNVPGTLSFKVSAVIITIFKIKKFMFYNVE